MWISPNEKSYTHFYRWVEVARYVPSLERVVREQDKDKQPVLYSVYDLQRYRTRHKNLGLYSSIWQYDTNTLSDSSRKLGNLYFDFDDETDPEKSFDDAKILYSYFLSLGFSETSMKIYFTGLKGFHLEVEAFSLACSANENLPALFRFIGTQIKNQLRLSTLDLKVYDARRMWRLPNSIHQKTGLYKIRIDDLSGSFADICQSAKEPNIKPDPIPCFDMSANVFYRQFLVELEEYQQRKREERIEKFNKLGTMLVKPTKNYVSIVWNSVLEDLKNASKGSRNDTLFQSGLKLYSLVAKGGISKEEVSEVLYQAGMNMGLSEREIERTLDSAEKIATDKEYEQYG